MTPRSRSDVPWAVRVVLLALALLCLVPLAAGDRARAGTPATNRFVSPTGTDTGDCTTSSCLTIQYAIGQSVNDDVINVAPGTYTENVVLAKRLTLNGAHEEDDACDRDGTGESIITAATGTLLTLQTGSAGSDIDGFTFKGGTRSIESTSGPLDGLRVRNNRLIEFTGNGMFFNDNGVNMFVHQNLVDGTSKTGSGGLVHFDTDNFDGLQFNDNCVRNGLTATGFFVDGNHNVGPSTLPQSPSFNGNVIENNQTGANLGRFAFESGSITGNIFRNNTFDGLQGGIQNSIINLNSFTGNGRHGLALTGFSGSTSTDSTRGAFGNTVSQNCMTGNGFINAGAGISFNAFQFPGTISTNEVHQNNISGNNIGATYAGSETIDAESNWWGAADGPSGTGPGSGDSIVGAGIDFTPFLTAIAGGTPCTPVPETLESLGIASLFFSVTQAIDQDKLIDIKVEILKNSQVIGGGEWLGADIAGLDAAHSTVVAVPLALNSGPVDFDLGDKLKIRVKVRRSDNQNFKVRLWYNTPVTNNGSSRFRATINSQLMTFFLRGANCPSPPCNRPLETSDGNAARSALLTVTGTYKTYGTWSYTFE